MSAVTVAAQVATARFTSSSAASRPPTEVSPSGTVMPVAATRRCQSLSSRHVTASHPPSDVG